MPNYAGQGVDLINDVMPAAKVVLQMVSEAEDTIRNLATLLEQSMPSQGDASHGWGRHS
jgi:hypothetical protein